jgi:hypothetical protein
MNADLGDLAQPSRGGDDVCDCPVGQEQRCTREPENLTWSVQRCLGYRALYPDLRPDPASLALTHQGYALRRAAAVGDRPQT